MHGADISLLLVDSSFRILVDSHSRIFFILEWPYTLKEHHPVIQRSTLVVEEASVLRFYKVT